MQSKVDVSELAKTCRALFQESSLQLENRNVLTEAATGAFSATACLAARAGANVFAFTKNSKFGSGNAAIRQTKALARKLNVENRIRFLSSLSQAPMKELDLLTNSGHLRPLRSSFLKRLGERAVVSLMVEPWEVRKGDISLPTLRHLQIPTAGPDEAHAKLGVFRFLGPLVEKILLENGGDPSNSKFFLVCNSRFEKELRSYFRKRKWRIAGKISEADIVVLGTGPEPKLSKNIFVDLEKGRKILQLWAEVPRRNLLKRFHWYPEKAPKKGHMGYLLSDLGPEPAIRLSFQGLKVGEFLINAKRRGLSFSETQDAVSRSKIALPPTGW